MSLLKINDVERLNEASSIGVSDKFVVAQDGELKKVPNSLLGSGDVDGPASSSDNALARFNGVTGKIIQSSLATLNDVGELSTSGINTVGANASVTAFAGGGQANATQLASQVNVVNTIASERDSVKLPTAAGGQFVTVFNFGGGNILDIFPTSGDTILNQGLNEAVSLGDEKSQIFFSPQPLFWIALDIIGATDNKFSTGTTTGTFEAGQLTGAKNTVYQNTNTSPGSISTRTATQMFQDNEDARVGKGYSLRIINRQSSNSLTVVAGTGVSTTGDLVIPADSWFDFLMTYTGTTTMDMVQVGVGTI